MNTNINTQNQPLRGLYRITWRLRGEFDNYPLSCNVMDLFGGKPPASFGALTGSWSCLGTRTLGPGPIETLALCIGFLLEGVGV